MNNELKKTLSIRIKRLDMFPNHFFGIAEINREEYKINIQGQSIFREKLIVLSHRYLTQHIECRTMHTRIDYKKFLKLNTITIGVLLRVSRAGLNPTCRDLDLSGQGILEKYWRLHPCHNGVF